MSEKEKTIFVATGRRKTSVARVRLMQGNGTIIVNDRPFDVYFCKETDRLFITRPLELSGGKQNFDITANITGGGISGQAGAFQHGMARALLKSNAELKLALKQAGVLTRDSRMKERKKYGRKKARKRFQFSKR